MIEQARVTVARPPENRLRSAGKAARLPGQGDQNPHMAEKENGKTDGVQADRATVPVRWPADVDLPPATFANQFFVHRVGDEVRFSFGQIAPIVGGSQEEQREQVAELQATGLVLKSVTRVVLTASVATQLLRVLAEQLEVTMDRS